MKNVSRKSTLNTDEAAHIISRWAESSSKHHAVDHSRGEYAYKLDGVTVTVNGPENYFSIFKRGVYGTYPLNQRNASCTAISPSSISGTTTLKAWRCGH